MSIANHLQHFLSESHTDYDVVCHPYAQRTVNTARAACVPSKQMAKGVVLHDAEGYVMAIVPSMNKVMLGWINLKLDRHLRLVTEGELNQLFPDCEPGAVPAMGSAYGMSCCWDDELNAVQDVYIEGGNHRELVHLQREQFQKLLGDQPHAAISCDPDEAEVYKG